MGFYTYEWEHSSTIAPTRLFKAFFLDGDNLIKKVEPRAMKCTEILEGDGGPGTIKKTTFSEGGQFGYVKHRIEKIDEASFTYCHTLFEGDALAGKIEKIQCETKLVPIATGGCTVKSTSKYCTVGDLEIKEDHIEAGKERALCIFELVEAYLKDNPDSYI